MQNDGLLQLVAEMKAGRVFNGWQEGKMPAGFKPTFKVERGEVNIKYDVQLTLPILFYAFEQHERSPAYTDRVLWRSLPGNALSLSCAISSTLVRSRAGFENGLRHTGLGSGELVLTSDHKPVYATFEVDLISFPTGTLLLITCPCNVMM